MRKRRTKVRLRIAEWRARRGLTQAQLAELLEVSRNQEQSYESGETDIRLSRLVRIADALGVGLSDLLAVEMDSPAQNERERALLDAFRAATNEGVKDWVIELLKRLSGP
jgi:transcriptional regulator with XRE-family HTH domain